MTVRDDIAKLREQERGDANQQIFAGMAKAINDLQDWGTAFMKLNPDVAEPRKVEIKVNGHTQRLNIDQLAAMVKRLDAKVNDLSNQIAHANIKYDKLRHDIARAIAAVPAEDV